MRITDRLKLNSVVYLAASLIIRWSYLIIAYVVRVFSGMERAWLHLVLALASLVFAWIALQLYRKSSPTGSNLGCFYLVLLVINFIGSIGAVFYALVHLFNSDGQQVETFWLL